MNAEGLARACASGLARAVSDSSRAAAEAPEDPDGTPVAESSTRPSQPHETRPEQHHKRTIDTERAGGTGNAAPIAEPDPLPGAAPVGVDDACATVDGWLGSGMTLFGLHQVAIALRREVARLRMRALNAHAEQSPPVFPLDAVAEIIGCSRGAACTQDDYGWASCCLARRALVRKGLIPAPERKSNEDEDYA